jgi:diguanylate cyclase (GGDEF)-like protein
LLVRRLVMSRLFVAAVVGVALAGMVCILLVLDTRQQERTDGVAHSAAQVIASAVVHAHLDSAAVEAGQLTPGDVSDIRDDVRALRRAGQLLDLSVWRLDGTPLFQDQRANSSTTQPSVADLTRARSGVSWTAATGQDQRRVILPLRLDTAPPSTLAEVVIPESVVADAIGDLLLRQQLVMVVLVVLPIGGLLWLRHGLLRRERHARQDSLTGLLNRRALYEDAPGVLAGASQRRPVALLLIDLGEFKTINDTLGHAAGDLLLQQVAGSLKAMVRGGDLVVRLGGDEFAILLTDLSGTAAGQRAEQLLDRLRKSTFTVHSFDLTVDASIGVALAPEHGRRIEELLQHADVAMYQAKRAQRGTAVYDPGTDEHSVDQLAMVTELRRALDNGEFVLHYQPKISLPDRQVTGVEALVRWQHPTRGLLAPGEFLPLLESTGLMHPLSHMVLREAVHQAASWRRAGMPLKVAVNLSPRSLLNPELPARVLATLAGADLPASFLELEITESAVMTNPERAAFIVAQLRTEGISVSIDDFGAGYTGLALLRTLPVTALKIDRSLVTHMLDCDQDEAVTQAVIDLAHRLHLDVIAEGVENEALLDRLTALGCDQAQGYLISRPLPAAALEGWLAGRLTGSNRPLHEPLLGRMVTPAATSAREMVLAPHPRCSAMVRMGRPAS